MPDLPKTLKIITIWLLVGTLVFLAVLWWQSYQNRSHLTINGNTIEIRRASDGHYYWEGSINNYPITFMIDTGASLTLIPEQITEQEKLTTLTSSRFNTAGGTVEGQIVQGDVVLEGGISMTNLRMGIIYGNTTLALLGMDVISQLHMTQSDGVMRFEP